MSPYPTFSRSLIILLEILLEDRRGIISQDNTSAHSFGNLSCGVEVSEWPQRLVTVTFITSVYHYICTRKLVPQVLVVLIPEWHGKKGRQRD